MKRPERQANRLLAVTMVMAVLMVSAAGAVYAAPHESEAEQAIQVSTLVATSSAPTQATPSPEPEILYDVPLDDETQRYIISQSEARGIEPRLVMAVISAESGFQPDAVSATDDYGLMQINAGNASWLADTLGTTDLMDKRQNIEAGVYILSLAAEGRTDTTQILMVYNMGSTGAARAWNSGITSTAYTDRVLAAWDEIEVKSC